MTSDLVRARAAASCKNSRDVVKLAALSLLLLACASLPARAYVRTTTSHDDDPGVKTVPVDQVRHVATPAWTWR